MNSPPIDPVVLAGLFVYMTNLGMQLVKPFIEKLPGIMLPANLALHDNLLRIILGVSNLGLLLLAAHSVPRSFAGWQWWDIIGLAFVQTGAGIVSYKVNTAGKVDVSASTAGTANGGGSFDQFGRPLTPPVPTTPSATVPVVPR